MNGKMFRQGDILLRRLDEKPESHRLIKEVPDKIILRGEATGHAHRVTSGRLFRGLGDEMFVEAIEGDTAVIHEEHETIMLPDGWYQVIRQREYTGAVPRAVND